MYLDSCYIAKFYWNEPDSLRVRDLIQRSGKIYTSVWALAEFHAVLHRRVREGVASPAEAGELSFLFSEHVREGLWNFIPVHEALLRRTGMLLVSAPREIFLRTADAVHLATAQELGERDVWTNDRHMLAAASYFGLIGRSV